MSTKGGGLTVTRRGALGHGINTFASPLATKSRKIRAYLVLLNHHTLSATQTYATFTSWNSTIVACEEIKVVSVLDIKTYRTIICLFCMGVKLGL